MSICCHTPPQPVPLVQKAGTKWWKTNERYAIAIEINGKTHVIHFSIGFRYDRASVPTALGIIMTKDSLGCAGPLLHDALYRCQGIPARWESRIRCSPNRVFTRREADEAFRAVMIADGISRWRAWSAWAAVRLFARRW